MKNNSKKSVVLFSGGLDSTTCLALAVKNFGAENVVAVSIFYGQRHAKELDSAKKIAAHYKIPRYEFNASEIMTFSDSALLNSSEKILEPTTYGEQVKKNSRVATYIPFRNGLMISMAASFADGFFGGAETEIFIGVHQDDSAVNAYADCREDFIHAMNSAVKIGTYGKIKIVAPFLGKTKADIVRLGLELSAPYELTWSCYDRGDVPCGVCATCRDRADAFRLNGTEDPALKIFRGN